MAEQSSPPGRAIRILDIATSIATFLLAVVTAIALPLAIYTATGSGSLTVEAELAEPFFIELFDGRRVSINEAGVSSYENFPIGDERATISDVPPAEVTVSVQRSDLDTRAIALGSIVAYFAASWVGLLSLRRVVRAAAVGHPFHDGNPKHLRRVGWSVLAIIAIDVFRVLLLNATLESDIAVRVTVPGTSRWILLTAAIGFFALAGIFAEASRLRRFEEATI